MRERVKSVDKLIPVFHRGSDWKHLERILNFEPKIQYMAFGALVGAAPAEREVWIEQAFKVIKASKNPDIKVHAFGMTSLSLLEQFPFYSADSTSWIMTAASGGIMTKYGVLTISENKKKLPEHILNMPAAFQQELADYVASFGFDLKTLSQDYKERFNMNIAYLTNWAANYEYKPKKTKQNKLF
jgi:hypothetical protein